MIQKSSPFSAVSALRQSALPAETSAQVFVLALKQRPLARSPHFFLHCVTTPEKIVDSLSGAPSERSLEPSSEPANPLGPRLGLVIPKRFLKHAVSRNRVKRVVRELFRLHQNELNSATWVVRLFKLPTWHQRPAHEFRHNCRAEISALLKQVSRSRRSHESTQ